MDVSATISSEESNPAKEEDEEEEPSSKGNLSQRNVGGKGR